jgi:flagellar FliL protein
MSVQIAVMTHYDDRVFENVKKHDFAIRSAVMDVMRLTTDADLVKPDFRKNWPSKYVTPSTHCLKNTKTLAALKKFISPTSSFNDPRQHCASEFN